MNAKPRPETRVSPFGPVQKGLVIPPRRAGKLIVLTGGKK